MNAPTRMLPTDIQLANEYRFSKKHIDGYIRKEFEHPDFQEAIEEGVQLLQQWMEQTYYDSKQKRIDQIRDLDLTALVTEVLVGVAHFQREELFTSVSAQLASRLNFSDKPDAIATMAEILAVLCETNAFDIIKASDQASLTLRSRMPLSQEVKTYIDYAAFLPPMVCSPNYVDNNRKSGYLTHNDSLVLGSGNHHEGDLCLDVINLQNAIPLSLNKEFLLSHELEPSYDLETQDQIDQWKQYKEQSHELFLLMLHQGNRFYLTNKVDKRGRLYSVGYHINTQGSQFQKAMIELADAEIVEGV